MYNQISSNRAVALIQEFIIFGIKEARACIFPAAFFLILFLSSHISIPRLPRYDLILILALLVQVLLVVTGTESIDELKVLTMFHVIGLGLELFKTHPSIGSWSYPEFSFVRIGTVPLYSGFMYSAVASYMCQAWRIFHLRLERVPPYMLSLPLCVLIYMNFFTHHFFRDLRWVLMAAVVVIFLRTRVYFRVLEKERSMPLVLSFILIGFFIWIAENVSTYYGAWAYPDQLTSWTIVSTGKISSWILLVIISFIIVADLKLYKEERQAGRRSIEDQKTGSRTLVNEN
jgi:uncharacterized membrane protein YoaT (DUF817 family)